MAHMENHIMAHHVFISHSQKDKAVADALCHKLEEDGIRCWIAPRDIAVGANWAESIVSAITASTVLVLIFSSHADKSKQVIREVEMAINNDVILIPLRIEDVLPSGSMSYFLSTTHWIDALDQKMESKFQLISNRIRTLLEQPESDQQLPSQAAPAAEKTLSSKKTIRFSLSPLKIGAAVLIVAIAVAAAVFLPRLLDGGAQDPVSSPAPLETTPTMAIAVDTAEPVSDTQIVEFGDPALEDCVRKTLIAMGEVVEGTQLTEDDMSKLEYLVIASESSAEVYREELPDQTSLDEFNARLITMNGDIYSLSGLEFAVNLNQIIILDKNIRNVEPLSGLRNLSIICLDGNSISDISPLSGLTGLRELHLRSNLVKELGPLEGVSGLRTLQLDNNSISDISALSQVTGLEELSLQGNNIDGISLLGSMDYLTSLNLSGCGISDISFFTSLRKIKTLYLAHNNISDISPLANLSALEYLDLSDNENILDLSVMGKLVNLRTLLLSSDGINDIYPLIETTKLVKLALSDNNIVDINPLEPISGLQELRIDGNFNINDSIMILNSFSELKTLYVEADLHNRYFDELFKGLKEKGVAILDARGAEITDW